MPGAVLDWAVLAVSFFNTISLLWLGLMVLLAGNRRSAGTWLTGIGLLLGALFFTSHTAILGRGLGSTSLGMDFWWWVSWLPAAAAPLAWYGSMLWHSGYRFDRPHSHHAWLIVVLTLGLAIGLLLIFANPLPSYEYVAGRVLRATPSFGGVPLLILVYMAFSLLCYLLPLDVLRRQHGASPTPHSLEARSRSRARPWLVAASIALLLAGILLTWTAFWAVTTRPIPTLSDPMVERTVKLFDLAVAMLVGVAITLLGRAIVAFEVFTGRPLPRNRFFRQWRSTVILAGGFGMVASWTLTVQLRPVYSLMLATILMTLFYALYAWRAFAEREAFMARLRPFVASQDLYGQMTTQQDEAGLGASALFETLCRDVLEVQSAALIPAGTLATLTGPPLVFPPGKSPALPDILAWAAQFRPEIHCLPVAPGEQAAGFDWAVPLWSSRGLDGVLLLGEKRSRSAFTEEEIEIAQAAGERLLDVLAGAEMARLSMELLRQRLAQARVMEGQGRRVLHDEVLPQLHTALLYLSGGPSAAHPSVQQASEVLSAAHRRIATLMRELPLPTPHRLAQGGLAVALQSAMENDFRSDFDEIKWNIDPQASKHARELPLFVNEVLFFAARELVRNAAVHGRVENSEQQLCLSIAMAYDQGLHLTIEDNGVGIRPDSGYANGSMRSPSGSGLRIHSAMLAAVGGRLEVQPGPNGGTRAVISI